nr:hypothetical protein [Candidatus Woesearchaeota archaeon]
MDIKKLAKYISIVAILAMVLSLYLTYLHYSIEEGPCNINENLNCDVVNKSQWSEMFGVSISLLGFFVFLVVFTINMFIIRDKKEFIGFDLSKKKLATFLLLISTWNFLYSIYLLGYVSYYKLQGVYCPFCIVVDILILVMFILSIIMFKVVENGEKNT